jgi:hypothetical protein
MDMVNQIPAYKNKMKTLELKHNQARTNKKKGSKNKIQLVIFEFHMKKKMPPKERVLAFMMKFSMGIFFPCWVCVEWLVVTWRVYNEFQPYHWCFDYRKWMINLKLTRRWNCKSQG